jgi:hypothetical protein
MLSNVARLVLALSLAGLAACAGGPDSDSDGQTPAPASSGTAKGGKEPAKSTDSTTPAEDDKPSVGAECTAYLACCDEVAKSTPAAAGSCDATRTQLESAQDKGTSTASLESSCKQALAGMKSAGYCK